MSNEPAYEEEKDDGAMEIKPRNGTDSVGSDVWVKGTYRGKEVAIKLCEVDKGRFLDNPAGKRKVWDLIKEMSALRHPNVVLFMGAYQQVRCVGLCN